MIGAGPAGIMAAIEASKYHDVTMIDGNEKIGKKLFITGKGRCNVTNAKDIYLVIRIFYTVHYIHLLMKIL